MGGADFWEELYVPKIARLHLFLTDRGRPTRLSVVRRFTQDLAFHACRLSGSHRMFPRRVPASLDATAWPLLKGMPAQDTEHAVAT